MNRKNLKKKKKNFFWVFNFLKLQTFQKFFKGKYNSFTHKTFFFGFTFLEIFSFESSLRELIVLPSLSSFNFYSDSFQMLWWSPKFLLTFFSQLEEKFVRSRWHLTSNWILLNFQWKKKSMKTKEFLLGLKPETPNQIFLILISYMGIVFLKPAYCTLFSK